MDALNKTDTWKLVDILPHVKTIDCRWIYKIKHHDGTIERFNAKLVANYYNQIMGLDYFNTYSLFKNLTIFTLVIALTSIPN